MDLRFPLPLDCQIRRLPLDLAIQREQVCRKAKWNLL